MAAKRKKMTRKTSTRKKRTPRPKAPVAPAPVAPAPVLASTPPPPIPPPGTAAPFLSAPVAPPPSPVPPIQTISVPTPAAPLPPAPVGTPPIPPTPDAFAPAPTSPEDPIFYPAPAPPMAVAPTPVPVAPVNLPPPATDPTPADGKVDVKVNVGQNQIDLGADLDIDPARLEEAYQTHAAKLGWWINLMEEQNVALERIKMDKDLIEAQTDQAVRQQFLNDGQKITENVVRAHVAQHPNMRAVQNSFLTAYHDYRILRGAVASMEARTKMLEAYGFHLRADFRAYIEIAKEKANAATQ